MFNENKYILEESDKLKVINIISQILSNYKKN
jgi:hypothetical protein